MARSTLAVALNALALTAAVLAQPSNPGPFNPPANGPRRADSTWTALADCTLHVRPGEALEHATIVFRDGRIVAVLPPEGGMGAEGEMAPARLPIGPRIIETTGKHVYPAFIDPFVEVDAPAPPADRPGRHWNEHVTPERTARDGGAGIDTATAEALRKIGFGAAAITPRGGIFRGSAAVVSLAAVPSDRSADRPPAYADDVYQSVAFSSGGSGYPGSQMGAVALIRQTFFDADWQQQARAEYGYNEPTNSLDALRRSQTEGRGPDRPRFVFDAQDELDALRIATIAREVKRRAIVLGTGTEFRRLEAIKADGLSFFLPLNFPRTPDASTPSRLESLELRDLMTWEQAPTNPRRLDAAGVTFALTTAKLRDRSQFLGNVRKAIKHGLSADKALAALTTIPADMLGIGDQLGSLDVGKRASVIIADGPIFDEKTRVHDLWIDGVRHEMYAPGTKLEGDWALTIPGAPEARRRLEIDSDNAVTVRRNDKTVKATKVQVDGNRLTFAFDHDPLDGPKGVFVMSAAIEKGADGTPARLLGQGIRGDGTPLAWSAEKLPRSLAGDWPIVFTGPDADSHPTCVLRADSDNNVSLVREQPGEPEAVVKIEGATWDGKSLACTLTKEHLGADCPDATLTATADWTTKPPTLAGTVKHPGGQFAFGARRRDAERWYAGTWRVVSLDGTPKPDGAPDQVRLEISQRRLTVAFSHQDKPDTRIEADDLKIDGATITFSHDLAPIGGEGKSQDVLKRAGAEIRGTGTLPDGSTHDYTLRQEFADARKDDGESVKDIPENLPTPFGPYGLDALPPQGTFVITNATLWTNTDQGVLTGATLVIKSGKVAGVFPMGNTGIVPLPADAVTIDGTGLHVTPGIIDCHSHTGISRGVNEGGQAVTAECRIQDVTNPDTTSWYWQLAGGVTAVNNLHGSANAIGGQSQTNKVRWGAARPNDMHFEGAAPGIKFALGENPRRANSGGQQRDFGGGATQAAARYPVSRMGVETLIRDRFTAAREYAAAFANASSRAAGTPPPRRDLELEALAEVLAGTRLIHCHSYRQDEIVMLCQVAGDFGFKIGTFQHILEGYKVADYVRDYSGGGSGFTDWWAYKVEVQDAIPGGLPLMHDVGAVVSFNSDSDELARRLNTEAAKAVKYGGLSEEDALKFVTLNPARQLRVDDRVGTLDVGKDADVAVWTGSPLSSFTRCAMTFVDGRRLFSLEQDAKHRETISKERQRLIQKVLSEGRPRESGDNADRPDGPPRSGPGGPPGGRGRRRPPQEEELIQRYYEDLMFRGKTANEPGECGCGFLHE